MEEKWNDYDLVTVDQLFGRAAQYQKNATWNSPDSQHLY